MILKIHFIKLQFSWQNLAFDIMQMLMKGTMNYVTSNISKIILELFIEEDRLKYVLYKIHKITLIKNTFLNSFNFPLGTDKPIICGLFGVDKRTCNRPIDSNVCIPVLL